MNGQNSEKVFSFIFLQSTFTSLYPFSMQPFSKFFFFKVLFFASYACMSSSKQSVTIVSPTSEQAAKARTVLNMLRSPQAKGEAAVAEANRVLDAAKVSRDVANLRTLVDHLNSRIALAEARQDRHERLLNELLSSSSRHEETQSQMQSDFLRSHQELEQVTINFERERGRIADVNEQLQFLTMQVKEWREAQLTPTQATYWAIASWVYVPLLHFLKGIWVLLFPLIATLQNLTLFNSGLLVAMKRERKYSNARHVHYPSNPNEPEKGEETDPLPSPTNAAGKSPRPSLLDMLQSGALESFAASPPQM